MNVANTILIGIKPYCLAKESKEFEHNCSVYFDMESLNLEILHFYKLKYKYCGHQTCFLYT